MAGIVKITLQQEAWMRRHFKHTKNEEISDRFGWSQSTMHRVARQLGLTKSADFMRSCQRATADAAKASHLRNGTYPPKGYVIPRSEEFRFKPGHKESKTTKRKRIAKATATRRQTIKEEKARVTWGFHQLTKLRLIRQPKLAVTQRYYLRKRGYIVPRGSMVAYYTDETKRCPKLEGRKLGDRHFIAFTFQPA